MRLVLERTGSALKQRIALYSCNCEAPGAHPELRRSTILLILLLLLLLMMIIV